MTRAAPCFRGHTSLDPNAQAIEGRESMGAAAETFMPTSIVKVSKMNTPSGGLRLQFHDRARCIG